MTKRKPVEGNSLMASLLLHFGRKNHRKCTNLNNCTECTNSNISIQLRFQSNPLFRNDIHLPKINVNHLTDFHETQKGYVTWNYATPAF